MDEVVAEAVSEAVETEDYPGLENPDVFAAAAERQAAQDEVIEAIQEQAETEQEEAAKSVLEEAMPELSETEETPQETSPDKIPETEEIGEDKPKVQEPMVEQLSLLDDQLPHLEAANAPEARKAKAVLEGLLFLVGDDGITAEQAAATLDITPELAKEYFDDLMKVYLDEDRGIEIANYGGTYRFLSKASVHEYAKKLFQISKQATLSQAALETLAIIAYKQPITRVEIEEIRGVGADMMLRKLMARDLIRESGRSEAAGRPILYEVTEEFMNSFKLMSLKELPELPQFNESEESEDLFRQ
jgi:segregation and condensation protein B